MDQSSENSERDNALSKVKSMVRSKAADPEMKGERSKKRSNSVSTPRQRLAMAASNDKNNHPRSSYPERFQESRKDTRNKGTRNQMGKDDTRQHSRKDDVSTDDLTDQDVRKRHTSAPKKAEGPTEESQMAQQLKEMQKEILISK